MTKLFSNYKRAAIDFASAQGNYLTDTDWQDLLGFFIRYRGNQSGLPSPCQSGFDRSGGQDFAPA